MFNFQGNVTLVSGQVPPEKKDITVGEQIGAAFQAHNTVVNIIRENQREQNAAEPGFDPLMNLEPGEEAFASVFVDANSEADMIQIRQRIRDEANARRILGEGPLNEFLVTLLAVGADLTTVASFGIGIVAKGAGLLRSAGRAAGIGVLDAGASESILQSKQLTRETSESIGAIVGAAFFGSAFGVGGAALARRSAAKFNKASKDAAADMTALGKSIPEDPIVDLEDPLGGAVGAATPEVAPGLRPENTLLANSGKVAEVLAKLKGFVAPALELAVSPFAQARALGMRLFDSGMVTKGQVAGFEATVPLDLKIRSYNAITDRASRYLAAKFKEARALGLFKTRQDFFNAVGRSMRRGDVDPVPQVAEAAKMMRERVLDPLKDSAIHLGLLPEGVEPLGAVSYFTRIYNREAIAQNDAAFQKVLIKWLRTKVSADEVAADGEYALMARDITDKIMGSAEGRVPFGIKMNEAVARGPLKERVLDIPDTLLEPFLDSNVLNIITRYIKTLGADIEIQREFGQLNLDRELSKLTDEAEKMIAKLQGKEASALRDRLNKEKSLLEASFSRIRGTDAKPFDPRWTGMTRIGRTFRTANFLRLLGSVAISSIPDLGRIVMEEGLARTMGRLFTDAATGFKGLRMGLAEARLAGTALDMHSASRIQAILDIGERFNVESKFERGVNAAGQSFGSLALINQWNTGMKSVTSMLVSSRILATVQGLAAGKKISPRDIRKLAQGSISPAMARRIAKQAGHFEVNGGVILANTEAWTDIGAVTAFRNALLRDVDNTIITPGAGDAPLWTTTEWGKALFQFKRFAMASVQRTVISGLQQRDMATLNGIMIMVALGSLSTALKDITKSGTVKERTGAQWVTEGIDRSGVVGIFTELDALSEKVFGASVQSLASGRELSRFQTRGVIEQIGGPSAGLVVDMTKLVSDAVDGKLVQRDAHNLRRLIPGGNLFYLHGIFNAMIEANLPAK